MKAARNRRGSREVVAYICYIWICHVDTLLVIAGFPGPWEVGDLCVSCAVVYHTSHLVLCIQLPTSSASSLSNWRKFSVRLQCRLGETTDNHTVGSVSAAK